MLSVTVGLLSEKLYKLQKNKPPKPMHKSETYKVKYENE